jgi:hypothetical protein
MKNLILVLVVATFLGGCSGTLKTRDIDAKSKKFPTDSVLADDGVKIAKPFEAKFKPMAYVKLDSKNTKYNEFLIKTIEKMGAFDRVVLKSDLEAFVLEKKLTDRISNISDLVGLNQLQKQIGPFLVIEPLVEWKGGYNYWGHLKAIDPSTGETVFLVEQNAFNFSGLDDPLFYPLFNALLQWVRGEKISTASKK